VYLDIPSPEIYLIAVLLCILTDTLSPSDTFLRTITTGAHFASRKKTTSEMSKSKKLTRYSLARMRVAASSHTGAHIVELY